MTRGDLAMGIIILAILVMLFIHLLTAAHHPLLPVMAGAIVLLQAFSIGREWRCRR